MEDPELVRILDAWLTPPAPVGADPTVGGRLPEPERFSLTLPDVPLSVLPPTNKHPAWNAGSSAIGYRWGTGPAVLFVHGWGGSAASFALWLGAFLRAGFSVAAVDGPAHGGSPGDFASAPAIAGTIRAFSRQAGPFRSVVAHSVGAIAATLALADGEPFEKAVFLAPCCDVSHSLFAEADRQGLAKNRYQDLWSLFLETFGGDGSLGSAMAMASTLPLLRVHHDPADSATPYEESRSLCDRWQGATLVDCPGSGHERILMARGALSDGIAFLGQDTGL